MVNYFSEQARAKAQKAAPKAVKPHSLVKKGRDAREERQCLRGLGKMRLKTIKGTIKGASAPKSSPGASGGEQFYKPQSAQKY